MEKIKVIDLFAGCGGLSTGFEMENFEVVLALEKDIWASETYKKNHQHTKVITDDITQIKDLEPFDIDGIIGGPPCQGFSLSGKRDKNDPRNSLFMEFLRFVNFYKPKFFIMENVPGLLSMKTKKNENVRDLIIEEYNKIGYQVTNHILNAAEYGVPQLRQRVIFVGIRNDYSFYPDELKPKALLNKDNFITIDDAISDLPQINAGEGISPIKYPQIKEQLNDYQKWAREGSDLIYNHIAMRHTQRIIERFKNIKNGCSLKDVPKEHMQRKRGEASVISGKIYSQNNMRPFGDRPSPTIAASFQGNFIHPHLNRNYTAREAARLQSFPDKYIFYGARTTMSWEKNLSQYQQIGNAVPPLLAKAIAKCVSNYLNKYCLK